MQIILLAAVPAAGLLLLSIVINATPSFAQAANGPNVETVQFIQYSDENIALEELKSGNIDAYFWRIPLEVVPDVSNDPRVQIYERNAGSFGLLLNPAEPENPNTMNPFQFKEVRFALNYLVDREFVVNEILKGHGSPMFDPFGISSPEYLNVIDSVESFGFRHDPALADRIISDRLAIEGATKENGEWTFSGNPVTIKIFIRCDDTRRNSLGETLASELENIGFKVERNCGDLNNAQLTVYGSDPLEFNWHIYTEGYAGTSVFVKYNPTVPSQMYAPWFGNMPGAQDPSFWQYTNETLDEITQRIFTFDFASESERNELVKDAITMGIQESVRIFVVQTSEPYAASSSVSGLVNDFGAGITSRFSLVNAKPESGDSLKIGVKFLSQGSWNGVAGFKDTFSRTIGDALSDPGMSRNPYTGDVIPVRVEWTDVETNGPTGTVDIHPDAQKWDPYSQQWMSVGESGTQGSKSKVTFKINYSKWHNGIQMDKADLLHSYYFVFEWGIGNQTNDVTADSEFTSQMEVILPLLKGIRFLSDSEVESYVDVWHYDEKEIADYITIWAGQPWEITAAQERLVIDGKLAYSRGEATSKEVDWMSTVSPLHADMIKTELQEMKNEQFVPAALQGIVNPEDAIKRYDASIQWITEHRNAEIGNGPFYLDDFNADAQTATIKAFRDPSYPFDSDHWSAFETPLIASLERIETGGPITIGQPKTIEVYVNVAGQPSNEVLLSYFIPASDGTVLKGEGKPASGELGRFEINLLPEETSKLSAGPNPLKIFATSIKAYRPDFQVSTILATTGAGGAGRGFELTTTLGGSDYKVTGVSESVKVTKVAINPNVSVTVETEGSGEVELTLPKSMIDGINRIKAGTQDLQFTPTDSASTTTIRFMVPDGTTSVEILGAKVVPEFAGMWALLGAACIIAVLCLTRIGFRTGGRGLGPFSTV